MTAEEAIGDLPPIDARSSSQSGELRAWRAALRRADALRPAPQGIGLRAADADWPGFEAPTALPDHVIRYLPRDYELFARLNPATSIREAWRHAHDMLERTHRANCGGRAT